MSRSPGQCRRYVRVTVDGRDVWRPCVRGPHDRREDCEVTVRGHGILPD